jgi:hypothetical protein
VFADQLRRAAVTFDLLTGKLALDINDIASVDSVGKAQKILKDVSRLAEQVGLNISLTVASNNNNNNNNNKKRVWNEIRLFSLFFCWSRLLKTLKALL